jgi:hypothetical protein
MSSILASSRCGGSADPCDQWPSAIIEASALTVAATALPPALPASAFFPIAVSIKCALRLGLTKSSIPCRRSDFGQAVNVKE